MLRHALKKLQKILVGIANAFTKELRHLLQIGRANLSICNFHFLQNATFVSCSHTLPFSVVRSYRTFRSPVMKTASAGLPDAPLVNGSARKLR